MIARRLHRLIRVAVDHSGRVARIVISSPAAPSGLGGSAADIFEPFSASDPGAGLALATARRLIENQRGTIRAEFGPLSGAEEEARTGCAAPDGDPRARSAQEDTGQPVTGDGTARAEPATGSGYVRYVIDLPLAGGEAFTARSRESTVRAG